MGIGIAIIGILIAAFGLADALATAVDTSEAATLQALRYIESILGLILFALGIVVEHLHYVRLAARKGRLAADGRTDDAASGP
jgi:Ca2+/H+ antiporter